MGTTDRLVAGTRAVNAGPGDPIELYAALEGERAGLPIFCCPLKQLRLDGRALPERLVLTPAEAGIAGASLEWTVLRPAAKGGGWRRTRLQAGVGYWDLAVFQIQPDSTTGIDPVLGTARFAVGVAGKPPGGPAFNLASDGARLREGWNDPQQAPGFRVTRHGGDLLHERARGLAGIPFRADANRLEAIARIGLAATDLVVVPYEDLSGGPFGVETLPPLDSPGWEWLFERIATARRRSAGTAPFVGTAGRPVDWGGAGDTAGVAAGDVILVGDAVAFLDEDDGDGRLGNGDRVLHSTKGRLERGALAELPDGDVVVLRMRDLRQVVIDLTDAGYGPLPPDPLWTPRARRAMTAFQKERGLPPTGAPDAMSVQALRDFLARLDAPSAAADSSR